MKTIITEGWRFIAHSYALVNQYQSLEMLKRNDIQLFHRDLPYFNRLWRAPSKLWSPEQSAALRALSDPPSELKPDAVLRMGFPHFFHRDSTAARTWVFGTAECGILYDRAMGIGKPAREVLAKCETKVLTCSRWSANGFVRTGARADQVDVVPHGVDTLVFRPADPERRAELRKRLGWEGRFVILNVGAMTANKGITLLLKAVAALVERFDHIKVVLKGSDDLYPSSKNAYAALSALEPVAAERAMRHVSYRGETLSAPELASLYQAADLYVSPYSAEAFNMPVLEAAACGLPIVCTRGGCTDDFVDDQFALRVDSKIVQFPSGAQCLQPELEHLVELIGRAIEDEDLRMRAALASPVWVNERFTWRSVVDKLLGVFFNGD